MSGKEKGRGGQREGGRERKERKRILANVAHLSDSEATGTGLLRSRKGLSAKIFNPGFRQVTPATNLQEGFEQSCAPAPPGPHSILGKSLAVLRGGAPVASFSCTATFFCVPLRPLLSSQIPLLPFALCLLLPSH